MSLVEWNKDFSVGIEQFDRQHKKLVSMINELHEAMLARAAKEKCEEIISSMADYAVFHFKDEEKAFDEFGYDETSEHKKEHEDFIEKVSDFKNDFQEGAVFLSVKIMDFLKDWLLNHITGADKKYTSFLNSKGMK